MSSNKQKSGGNLGFFLRKGWPLVAIIIVIVAAAVTSVGVGVVLLQQANKNGANNGSVVGNVTTDPAEQKRKAVIKSSSTEANAILSKGGTVATAAVVYQDAIKATDDTKTKAGLLFDESILYFNDGDLNQALAIALESRANDDNENINRYIAGIYVDLNDKPNAILYYRKALSFVDTSDPDVPYSVEYYNTKISELGG